MRFAQPEWLTWLWGLLPLAGIMVFLLYHRRRAVSRLSHSPVIRHGMLEDVSYLKKGLAMVLLLGVFTFGLLALARPQWGTRLENVTRRGVDVLIAFDTSLSMETQDVTPNRLGRAREELISLLERLKDVRIGIITFAGTAFSQCPLTIDRAAARMFLEIVDTGLIPDPGTDIGKAIALARETFQKQQRQYKVLILITDGENLEGDPLGEARRAAGEGVVIYTIGVGTPSGQPIPLRDDSGAITGYKTDASGHPVISRLDETTLAEIARIGGGRYFRSTARGEEVTALATAIDAMEKKELDSRIVRRYLDRFQLPLLAALLCLVGEGLLLDRKNTLRRTWSRLRRLVARKRVDQGGGR